MASIKYTALINEIKGSINGTTFQGGYGGAIVKSKNSHSFLQTQGKFTKADAGRTLTTQAIIASIASSWKSLTVEQRLSWSAAAPNYPFKNRFSETYIASGFQVYMKINFNIVNINGARINVAPIPEVVPITPPYEFATAALPAFSFDMNPANYPAGCKLILSATGPVSQTVMILNKFKSIKIFDSTTVFPIEVQDDWMAVKGSIPTGAFIKFKLVAVNITTGQTGLPVFFDLQT